MRPLLFTLALVCLMKCDAKSQTQPIHQDLYQHYEKFKEPTIKDRRFKHADIVPLIKRLQSPFEVEVAGQSIEDREIYLVKWGNGPIKVLLWSQMHGDEPSATMALMDMFNFFSKNGDAFDAYRKNLADKVTLYFLPMLNPDGAEDYQRRNALGVDLNRDALRLQSPEARILKGIRDQLQADWGFNLHDQNRYYGAGLNPHTATISFLAPAYNYEKEVNEVRGNSMKLIGDMNAVLQEYIPGQVGKYNDAFEPRAFGDNIQKWGTSTILIESGGLKDDPEKQEIRKLNFVAIMTAFESIANGHYKKQTQAAYEAIPFNESNWFLDLIIREVEVEVNGQWFMVDIGYRRSEVDYPNNRSFYFRSYIHDLGDLSIFFGYEALNAKGLRAYSGKIQPEVISNVSALQRLNVQQLLAQGYTGVQLAEWPKDRSKLRDFPLEVIKQGESPKNSEILQGKNPSLLLKRGNKVEYAVVNGFLIKVN